MGIEECPERVTSKSVPESLPVDSSRVKGRLNSVQGMRGTRAEQDYGMPELKEARRRATELATRAPLCWAMLLTPKWMIALGKSA